MAFVKCPMSTMTKRVLWTNPEPTTSRGEFTVTLNDSTDNYDYIGIHYKGDTNSPNEYDVISASWANAGQTNGYANLTMSIYNSSYVSMQRFASKVSDTSIKFSKRYVSSSSYTDTICLPLEVYGLKMQVSNLIVRESSSLKDICRDKVLYGGYNEVSYTIYSNRLTVNEGKLVVDTTNKAVYVYLDFTTLTSAGASNDWATLLSFSSELANYLPQYSASNRNNMVGLMTDTSSDDNINFFVGYGSSNNPRTFGGTYGKVFSANEHYIVYGSWTY